MCVVDTHEEPKGISEVNGNSTRTLKIETGGSQVVGHVALHALGHFADRIELGDSLAKRIPWGGESTPTHDRVCQELCGLVVI